MRVFAQFICQSCGQKFMGDVYADSVCPKCGKAEILCPACEEVHRLSAAMQDHYLAKLLAQLEN